MFFARLLLGFLVLTVVCISKADTQPRCTSYSSSWLGKTVSFCIQRSRNDLPNLNEPVVYFLHGLGGNESSWSREYYLKALVDLVSHDSNFPAITFISFETELDSFFSDFDGVEVGPKAYESWFINDFIPFIEEKFLVCKERACRGIAGLSMGGFGALKMALKHPNMFSVGAANSPALPPFSIHESNELWKEYFSDTKVGIVKGMLLLRDIRRIFPSEKLYQANNPISLVENFSSSNIFPSLYFDVGSEDNFGFQVGYQNFKTVLDLNEYPYSSFMENGGDHFIYHHRNKDLLKFIRDWALRIY